MNEIVTKIRHAILEDNSTDKLVKLVLELSSQGFTRQNIYKLFLQYHIDYQYSEEWIRIENKFNGDHPVDLVLDRILGWCRPEIALLANEPLEKP